LTTGPEREGLPGRSDALGGTAKGLAFLALLAFVSSFFAARVFTTLNPDVVVVSSGIHFHHFWYGLAMVVVAGWLGIVSSTPAYDRVFAVVFGLGLGLIGDETGLLLTLGDYHSELTYVVFLGGVSVAAMTILAFRFEGEVVKEVASLERGEAAVHLGVGVVAVSFLPFAFGHVTTGAVVLALGVALALVGVWTRRHCGSRPSPAAT
jgi:hypothetical protein